MRLRPRAGQTATEYMLVISVIVISLAAAAYLFIPQFQGGVVELANDVSIALATGQVGGVGFNRGGGGATPGVGTAAMGHPTGPVIGGVNTNVSPTSGTTLGSPAAMTSGMPGGMPSGQSATSSANGQPTLTNIHHDPNAPNQPTLNNTVYHPGGPNQPTLNNGVYHPPPPSGPTVIST